MPVRWRMSSPLTTNLISPLCLRRGTATAVYDWDLVNLPALIIAPKNTIPPWVKEMRTVFPESLQRIVAHGDNFEDPVQAARGPKRPKQSPEEYIAKNRRLHVSRLGKPQNPDCGRFVVITTQQSFRGQIL